MMNALRVSGRLQPISRGFAVACTVVLAGLLSACSGSPTAPGLTSERRVETGGGGGTLCPNGECGYTGRLEILAAGQTLNAKDGGVQHTGPTDFEFSAHPTGSARYDDVFISFLSQPDSTALVTLTYTKSGRSFGEFDKLVPVTYQVTDDKACESGKLVQTTVRANFQNFGSTLIVESHCASK